jgi:glycosyltransferase involved in cell wall biosynthesis
MVTSLGIVLTTYERADGKTHYFLERALKSINNQLFTNWKLYVVGDKYENANQLKEIVYDNVSDKKVIIINTHNAVERDKYLGINDKALWNCGGANARNVGNYYCLNSGYKWICALDHDDYWAESHLAKIFKAITLHPNGVFFHTLSSYKDLPYFPVCEPNGDIVKQLPKYANLIHSSVCQNYEVLNFMYRDMFEEQGVYFPSDGDMWNRVAMKCEQKNLDAYIIKSLTCYHETEGL